MTRSPGPVVTRRRLGGELKRLREGQGLKLEDVARRLECSPSKISRLENGKGVPRWRDVRDMLDVYAVPNGDQRERLLEWSRTGQQPMWWQAYADVLPSAMGTYVELEWDASRIRAYEPYVLHGLLQTRDYARAVLRSAYSAAMPSEDVEKLVEVRMRRQEALTSDHGLSFHCVLDESTLHRVVGSPAILQAQLEHLLAVAEAEHVDVRVLPFSAGLVRGSRGAFAKLDFSEGIEHGLVYVERPETGGEFLADPAEIADHGRWLEGLYATALSEAESIPLLKRAVRRIDRSDG
ncbi:helix-turn-helix domain-containing protein [Actinomycetospora callitridis]|uniref:helix-turn-helix domain-containing protein n=1 Tax=Actinomycetospora callitridis TaxID=913944 RepID=UPI002366B6FA|nr:helix-turn-helix transcriptional regulator [Actinomycetospora callitridis]MDD7920908.1 helix-turn-helix transcriptional regulator [Actinomycetospora callitridis]